MPDAASEFWYPLRDPESVASPCVLVYRDRLIRNIETAIRVSGDARRLRPHVKTHKSARVVALMLERGITRFKCATLQEVEMLVEAGAGDILLAYQPVGPNMDRLFSISRRRRNIRIACLVDCQAVADVLETLAERYGHALPVFLDLDVGMHRTGIAAGTGADDLYARIAGSRWLVAAGIHAYDGHARDPDIEGRRAVAGESREATLAMRARLGARGIEVEEVVLGGTPSFPFHADAVRALSPEDGFVTLSPGTFGYFDWGYASQFPDLPFEAAALVLGRVISIPVPGQFTVDVGSKAIGADPGQPRGTLLNLPEAVAGAQSEEHWAFTIDPRKTPPVGATVYVWPRHICTTVEHYDEVAVVSEDGRVTERWEVTARGRG